MRPQVPADEYLVPSTRRRLLIAALAVGMAVFIGWLLLYRPGGVKPQRQLQADVPVCSPSQQEGCVGGRAMVISPAAPATSAARR